jgi:hypothetical protein
MLSELKDYIDNNYFRLILIRQKKSTFLHIHQLNMMVQRIYSSLTERKRHGKKSFAVLIDPDKVNDHEMQQLIDIAVAAKVDYFLVGGSLVISNYLDECIQFIKRSCNIPAILFPGSPSQISKYADALLYLSLISGRNPELLIGHHVVSAPFVKQSGLEVMSTGYMVIDGGGRLLRFLTSLMLHLYLLIKMRLPCAQLWPVKCWE